ncbi:hypothetical protein T439DRAFT_205765 [Meredithblackwellia eburnea MCA 4105]
MVSAMDNLIHQDDAPDSSDQESTNTHHLSLAQLVQNRDSPRETPDREDSEPERSDRRSAKPNHKRKLSPHSSTPARSPAPISADPFIAPLPAFTPHTANLPPSRHEFFATRSHPTNKVNYRYTTCGPSQTPNLPLLVHRVIESMPQSVRFSWEDRSSFTFITEDARTITTEKGWRAARANVPIREGSWYWEVKVERCGGEGGRETGGVGEGGWVRVGAGRREAPLNAPVGFDGHSYAYRDRGGEAVTLSRPKPYGKPYVSNSVIGVYLSLPPRPSPSVEDRRDPARIVRKRVPIRYKNQLYFESLEYSPSKEMEELNADPANKVKPPVEEKKKAAAPGTKARPAETDLAPPPRPLPKLGPEAKIAFFLNGECQGVAYDDLYDFLPLRLHAGHHRKKEKDVRENWHDDGTMGYFPFVSVFGGSIATFNAGPDFEFPPPQDIEAALRTSPHPPSSVTSQEPPERTVEGEGERPSSHEPPAPWRPLSERYEDAFSEHTVLDDWDERESIRLFYETQAAEAKAAMNGAKDGGASAAGGRGGHPPSKRAKGATSKLLAEMGAVKREDVPSVGSPLASPRPSSPVAQRHSALSESSTPAPPWAGSSTITSLLDGGDSPMRIDSDDGRMS